MGSGQGSVYITAILAVLPDLISEIAGGSFHIGARTAPLADVKALGSTLRTVSASFHALTTLTLSHLTFLSSTNCR